MPSKTKKAVVKTKPVAPSIKNHEPALLVVLAYVIGFTTAFIAFHLSEQDDWAATLDYVGTTSVIESVATGTKLLIQDDGLFVEKDGKERVLSAKTNDAQADDGFHVRIIAATLSPDENFVHYCVQIREESDKCVNYIYSVDADLVYRVKNDTEEVFSLIEDGKNLAWDKDGSLVLVGYQSVDALEPWRMAAI